MNLVDRFEESHPALPDSVSDIIGRLGARLTFRRDDEIYAQDDEVEHLYRVVSGSVRTTRLTSDGRRQVGDFYYAGEVFGLETGPLHRFSAEALSECVVQVVSRASIRALSGDADLDRAILSATRRELERSQAHVLLLGRKSAREKVAGFLMGLAGRMADGPVDLAMGRQDMADYLGLTIETVSRTLTQLQQTAVVEFAASRRFKVTNRATLERLAA